MKRLELKHIKLRMKNISLQNILQNKFGENDQVK